MTRIICKDLHLKCFKRRRAQEVTDANCASRVKSTKRLLQKFLQSATDFVFFADEKMFSVASPDNRQNDHVYAPRATECFQRCCLMFNKSLMVSVAVSKLGCTPRFSVGNEYRLMTAITGMCY